MTAPKPPVGQQAETEHVAYLKDGSAHCKCGWPTDGVARRWHQVDIHIKQATCNHEWYQPPPPQSYCSSCFTNKPVASPVTLSGETSIISPSYKLAWEYRGEGLYLYWNNPYNNGSKEDVAMFMWPSHPPEDTEKVEFAYELMAKTFVDSWNLKPVAVTLSEGQTVPLKTAAAIICIMCRQGYKLTRYPGGYFHDGVPYGSFPWECKARELHKLFEPNLSEVQDTQEKKS